MNKYLNCLLLVLTTQVNAFVTLGTDNACDYNSNQYSLQQVIDLEAPATIRVTNQQTFYENIDITGQTLLSGGYADCQAANIDHHTGTTTINGGGVNNVLDINPVTTNFIVIKRFNLKNGAANGSNAGGGISITDTNGIGVDVRIHDSLISNNNGNHGGGIYLNGDLASVHLFNTLVLNNAATMNGGGIYCYGGHVTLNDDSGVALNNVFNTSPSLGNGGGLFLADGCLVQLRSGTTGSLFEFMGVSGNTASNNGGGLYLTSSARVIMDGAASGNVVNVNGNVADADHNGSGSGGGLYIAGAGSRAELFGALIKENHAQHGGGVAVLAGAQLFVGQSPQGCWNGKQCNLFTGNQTSDNGGFGGAVYLLDGHADIQRASFTRNRADNGVVIYADTQSTAWLRSSLVYNNGANGADDLSDVFNFRFYNSELVLNHVTLANNWVTGASIRHNAGSYSFTNSIIREPHVGLGADITNATGEEDCLLLHSDSGFDQLTNSLVANPYFVDEHNHDYRLSGISHAIDMCDDNLFTEDTDVHGEAMWDDPGFSNENGIRDAGADETFAGDVIFADPF